MNITNSLHFYKNRVNICPCAFFILITNKKILFLLPPRVVAVAAIAAGDVRAMQFFFGYAAAASDACRVKGMKCF
ncbi:MAG: hypothetical protein RSB39_06160 [Oscillospiraceae bacterium]